MLPSGLLGIALLLVACAPAAPSPTAAPPKPAAQPTTTAPAPPKPAAKATEVPAAKPDAKAATAPAGRVNVPKEVIDGANREGQLRLYWTSTATDQWRQKFQDAFNQFFGTRVTFTDVRGNDWARDTAKLIAEVTAGQKPAHDVMLMTETHHGLLFDAGLLGQHRWTEWFGVPEKSVMFKGGSFTFAHQVALPSYNTRLVDGADIPATWDDLLKPRFKDRIGVHTATHHWARLSQVWGEEKTTRYVQQLAAQNPKLGTPADLLQRLELGEIHVLATQIDNQLKLAQRKGSPVAYAEKVSPVLLQSLMAGPIKGAQNANAGLLFSGFLATPQGQALWLEFQDQASAFVEGSVTQKFVQGKEVVVLHEDFIAKELEPRTQKYGRMLGYR